MHISRRMQIKIRVTIEADSEEQFLTRLDLVKHALKWFNSRTTTLQITREEITKYIESVDVFTDANISETISQ